MFGPSPLASIIRRPRPLLLRAAPGPTLATAPTGARRPVPQPHLAEDAGGEGLRQGVCPRHVCPELLLLLPPGVVPPPGLGLHHELSADHPHRPQLADQLQRPCPRGAQRLPSLFAHRAARGNGGSGPRLTSAYLQPVPRRFPIHRLCPFEIYDTHNLL